MHHVQHQELSVFQQSRMYRSMLVAMRVEAARDLILCTTFPLKYIASKSGFADEAHMSHTFNRVVGYSPGKLRRQSTGN